jgi:hypothetical protein
MAEAPKIEGILFTTVLVSLFELSRGELDGGLATEFLEWCLRGAPGDDESAEKYRDLAQSVAEGYLLTVVLAGAMAGS